MTLDGTIKRYIDNAEYERIRGSLQGCLDFKQIAEWLKDYKRLLEQETILEQIRNEILELPYVDDMEITHGILEEAIGRDRVLKIINKYIKGGEKE